MSSSAQATKGGVCPRTFALGGEAPVGRLGLGTMQMTGPGVWGTPANPTECIAVLRDALDLGVTLFDTAAAYGPHVAEQLVAEALHPYREDVVVATKGGFDRPGPGVWRRNARPEVLRRQIDESLRHLRIERIDLWQLHRIDPAVGLDDQLEVVETAQRAGKIRFFGLSQVTLREVETVAARLPVATVTNRFNHADRESADVLSWCASHGVGFIPWYPLAEGRLTGADALAAVAARKSCTRAQIALAWLLHLAPVTLPIPGTARRSHLAENVRAFDVELDAEDLEMLR